MSKHLREDHPEDDFLYPGWLFNLDVFEGAKERSLSGYPTFYPIYDTIGAADEEVYDVDVEENEMWFVDLLAHGDILPDIFYVTISLDDQPVMPRQILRMSLMDLRFASPFPVIGRARIKVENPTTTTATYEAVLWYRKFTRTTINRALELLAMETI